MSNERKRLQAECREYQGRTVEHVAEIKLLREALRRLLELDHLKRNSDLPGVKYARAALEPKPVSTKPDLRALLPELAVIRQVMKEPKP